MHFYMLKGLANRLNVWSDFIININRKIHQPDSYLSIIAGLYKKNMGKKSLRSRMSISGGNFQIHFF